MALALDDSYLKAYLRRGTARARLGRLTEAKEGAEERAGVATGVWAWQGVGMAGEWAW